MISYLRTQFSSFDRHDFSIGGAWREAVLIFMCWAVPAFFLVLFVHNLAELRTVEYYQEAISQGIGPILWNFIAVFGCVMFFIAFSFNRVQLFSNVAQQLLVNVYAIGSLTFGLLFGQFFLLAPDMYASVEVWKLFFVFPLTSFLLLFALFQNFLMWYLSQLIRWGSPFLNKLSSINFMVRFFIGAFFSGLLLVLLWLEK